MKHNKEQFDEMLQKRKELYERMKKSGELEDKVLERAIDSMSEDLRNKLGLSTPKKRRIILL